MSKNPGLSIIWAVTLLVLACVSGCGKGDPNKVAVTSVIQNKGSDTMVNIAQAWAEAYKKAEPSVEVEVSGGGSGVGIAALSKGAVDIANSSRNMKAKEGEDAKRNTGKEPKEFIVGYDALAIIVHKDNPVEELTMEQIASIYQENSTVTKWSDLGIRLPSGHDKIIRLSRQSSSGTYEFLRERVLKNKDFGLGSLDLNGSKEVVELVANTYGAIGYSGMGYTTGSVKMIRVSPKAGEPGVLPTLETAKDKSYPISRSLQLYTLGEPQGAVKKYIDWIMSDAGQSIVEQSGFVSIPANLRTK
jgi:phosphate transport system substrate-binding protein